MKYFIDKEGNYLGGWDENEPRGSIEVPVAPDDARQAWNFEDSKWNPLPGMPEKEMKDSEIAQDKQFLADTDWIVAKTGEASFTGQDVAPLLDQYAPQLTERENARVRIRINEGRA